MSNSPEMEKSVRFVRSIFRDGTGRFMFCLAALAESYGQEVTPMRVKVYAQGLDDIPIEAIENACRQIIRHRTTATFPKVAEIREAIHGKASDKALLATQTIEKATSDKGPYCSIVFDDPYVHATIQALGGWEHICEISAIPDEWKFFKRDIERVYSALITAPVPIDTPLRLAGNIERINAAAGYDLNANRPQVEYIGDLQKIKAWRSQIRQLQNSVAEKKITFEGQTVGELLKQIGQTE